MKYLNHQMRSLNTASRLELTLKDTDMNPRDAEMHKSIRDHETDGGDEREMRLVKRRKS